MARIDKKVSGQRGKGRRIQPYAWLGAGAVTLGLGAAMASGAASLTPMTARTPARADAA